MRKYFVRVPRLVRGVYPSAIWSRDNAMKHYDYLHVTIDDGPNPLSTHRWLELLNDTKQKATFFLLASLAKSYPSIVDDIKSEGHLVASHGMQHFDGWKEGTSRYVDHVKRSLDILECRSYRPPYGRMTLSQYQRLRGSCDLYMWSLMPGDFDMQASESDISRKLQSRKDSDIIVFHDSPSAIDLVKQPFYTSFG